MHDPMGFFKRITADFNFEHFAKALSDIFNTLTSEDKLTSVIPDSKKASFSISFKLLLDATLFSFLHCRTLLHKFFQRCPELCMRLPILLRDIVSAQFFPY